MISSYIGGEARINICITIICNHLQFSGESGWSLNLTFRIIRQRNSLRRTLQRLKHVNALSLP